MKNLHSWNFSYSQARDLQQQLAGRVRFVPVRKKPGLVAGIDCAFSKDGQRIFTAVVVVNLPDFKIVETATIVLKVTFPYIPGLLSFREAPACIAAVEKLKTLPDVFIIDGQGVAHPRRLGLASHLGLFFDKPTIGCAKSRLVGVFEEPLAQRGSFSALKDADQTIGAVVRTRTNVKPVFVSVGNKCLLEDAIRIILACAPRYRLPEPTRLAHQLVSNLKLKSWNI
jgi:deoxyribonuclease V